MLNQKKIKGIEITLTVTEVADILRIHNKTVLKLIKSGKLRAIKIGRVYRITHSNLKNFMGK